MAPKLNRQRWYRPRPVRTLPQVTRRGQGAAHEPARLPRVHRHRVAHSQAAAPFEHRAVPRCLCGRDDSGHRPRAGTLRGRLTEVLRGGPRHVKLQCFETPVSSWNLSCPLVLALSVSCHRARRPQGPERDGRNPCWYWWSRIRPRSTLGLWLVACRLRRFETSRWNSAMGRAQRCSMVGVHGLLQTCILLAC